MEEKDYASKGLAGTALGLGKSENETYNRKDKVNERKNNSSSLF